MKHSALDMAFPVQTGKAIFMKRTAIGFFLAVLVCVGIPAKAQTQTVSATEIKALETRCDQEQPAACATLYDMYFFGRGVQQDRTRAAQYKLKHCEAGNGSACEYYAVASKIKREGYPAYNRAQYYDLMKRACLSPEEPSCRSANGIANNQNVYNATERAAIYKRTCAVEKPEACGRAAYAEGERGNWASALSLASNACSRGHQNACTNKKAYQARLDIARRNQERAQANARYEERARMGQPVTRNPAPPARRSTDRGDSNARSGTRTCYKSNGGTGTQYWYYGFDNKKKYGPCV